MNHSPNEQNDKASFDAVNFIRLQALLPALGVTRTDHCLHYGAPQSLLVRLMRNAGFSYYQLLEDQPAGVSSWPHLRPGLKLLSWFDESILSNDGADPLPALDHAFSAAPEMILGLLSVVVSDSVNLVPQWAARGQYQPYQMGGYFLLCRRSLSSSVLALVQSLLEDERRLLGDGFMRWLQTGTLAAIADRDRTLQREKLRAAGFRLAVDGTFFRYKTGLFRVWKSLLREWSANGFGEFIVVIDRENTAPKFHNIVYAQAPMHNGADRPADKALVQNICDQLKISLFISTYYSTPLTTPCYVLVPDMIPEVLNFDLQQAQWQEKNEAILYSRKYFSISLSTGGDLRHFYPQISEDLVVNAYCGCDFRTQSEEAVNDFRQRARITRPYFMISGSKTNQKNGELFFQAFARLGNLRAEFAVVCTMSAATLEPQFKQYMGEASFHGLYLEDDDLQCAYSGALALAYPSRYEGFGLPVLEAMACSCPVITCRNSSLPEVGADSVLYVDPDQPGEMLQALLDVQDPGQRAELIAKGLVQSAKFSWQNMANIM